MNARIFFKLLFFIWIFSILSCSSENTGQAVEQRGFDQEYLKSLNDKDAYDYDREFIKEEKTAGDDSPGGFWQVVGKIITAIAWFFNSVIGYLIIAFLIGLLVWILAKKSGRIFEKKPNEAAEKLIEVQPVAVEDKDYHKLIQAALKKQDYRMAIRFGFLSALTYLHKKELIEWKKDKTNYEYLFELPEDYQHLFDGMCTIYERIWYGKFDANKDLFSSMTGKFQEIKTLQGS